LNDISVKTTVLWTYNATSRSVAMQEQLENYQNRDWSCAVGRTSKRWAETSVYSTGLNCQLPPQTRDMPLTIKMSKPCEKSIMSTEESLKLSKLSFLCARLLKQTNCSIFIFDLLTYHAGGTCTVWNCAHIICNIRVLTCTFSAMCLVPRVRSSSFIRGLMMMWMMMMMIHDATNAVCMIVADLMKSINYCAIQLMGVQRVWSSCCHSRRFCERSTWLHFADANLHNSQVYRRATSA
jgi:hypothetical protein